MSNCIDAEKFHYVVNKIRTFFINKGLIECHTQNRLSILSACEDPTTLSIFEFNNIKYPLPQTGQMWLEHELLKNPNNYGYFCVSTSYRNEPNPIEGRHDLIFPMMEFEIKGDINDLYLFECELLDYLGYKTILPQYPTDDYLNIAHKYDTYDITHEYEQILQRDYGEVFFLKNFPEYTSPFWNMKRNDDNTAKKIDVILSGMETIGSAERCCDENEMRTRFQNISHGLYAKILYNHFGKERIDNELDTFFSNKFFARVGGGIGITRLIRSMEICGLIPQKN